MGEIIKVGRVRFRIKQICGTSRFEDADDEAENRDMVVSDFLQDNKKFSKTE